MQTERGNFRRRGWRESRPLVELATAAPTDLKKTATNTNTAESYYEINLAPQLDTLTETLVSRIQHCRAQILYRLRSAS